MKQHVAIDPELWAVLKKHNKDLKEGMIPRYISHALLHELTPEQSLALLEVPANQRQITESGAASEKSGKVAFQEKLVNEYMEGVNKVHLQVLS